MSRRQSSGNSRAFVNPAAPDENIKSPGPSPTRKLGFPNRTFEISTETQHHQTQSLLRQMTLTNSFIYTAHSSSQLYIIIIKCLSLRGEGTANYMRCALRNHTLALARNDTRQSTETHTRTRTRQTARARALSGPSDQSTMKR